MTRNADRVPYQHAPCGLLTTTPAGVITESNSTFQGWIGYSAAQLHDRTFASLLDAGSRMFFETRHAQVLHLQGSVDEVALTLIGADGSRLQVLVNAAFTEDSGIQVVLYAIFNATQRLSYERDLLDARRTAEVSEARLHILQQATAAFEVCTDDQGVAESFVHVARGAFAATEACVMLLDPEGELHVVAGTNPLLQTVPAIAAIRETPHEITVTADDAITDFPELAAGLQAARLQALSVTPLSAGGERLGLLACFFGRKRDFDTGFFELQRTLGRQASQTLTRVRLQRELEHLALYDQLTGIPNRQLLTQRLHTAIDAATAIGEPMTVIFIDVDDFKQVNDRFGHAAGDAVLRELAQRFRDHVRADDVVGRIGGDEFVVICHAAGVDAGASVAERVLIGARDPMSDPPGLHVSVSVGAATFTPLMGDVPTADDILNRADDAMYTSKARGKNQLNLFPGSAA